MPFVSQSAVNYFGKAGVFNNHICTDERYTLSFVL